MLKPLRQLFYFFAILSVIVVSFHILPAQAARPDSLKDVLSDSRPSTASDHDIFLDLAAGTQLVSGETVTFTFASGFDATALAIGDIKFINNGTTETLQSGACGSTDTVRWVLSSQTMTFTACNSYTAETAGTVIEIQVGLLTGGTHQVVNNTTASYTEVAFGTYGDDSQNAQVAIIGGVTLSATVAESLTHTTAGVTTGNCPDVTGATETEIDTSGNAATVPFGTISLNTFYGACQKLTVSTNAGGGYYSTVQTTALPTSGGNTISKGTCDGSCSDTTGFAWATATNSGYGYCMSDSTGTPAATADGTNWTTTHQCGGASPFAKTIANAGASQTAQQIMKKTSPANADASYIKYRITVGATQAAGTYTTTLVYIDTGTF